MSLGRFDGPDWLCIFLGGRGGSGRSLNNTTALLFRDLSCAAKRPYLHQAARAVRQPPLPTGWRAVSTLDADWLPEFEGLAEPTRDPRGRQRASIARWSAALPTSLAAAQAVPPSGSGVPSGDLEMSGLSRLRIDTEKAGPVT